MTTERIDVLAYVIYFLRGGYQMDCEVRATNAKDAERTFRWEMRRIGVRNVRIAKIVEVV